MGTRFLRMGVVLVLFVVFGSISPPAQASPEAPPPNDDFANAIEISGDNDFVTGTTIAATKEVGEPNHAGNAGGKSIWYKWVAPESRAFVFNTLHSSFDTLLAVYTGAGLNALVQVVSSDECWSGLTSCVVLPATAGTTYFIAVDGYGGGAGYLYLTWGLPPANDNFADAEILTGLAGSMEGGLELATKEPGEPKHAGSPGGTSVWYRWTAPETRGMHLTISTGGFATAMGIYTGSRVDTLDKVTDGMNCRPALFIYECMRFGAVAGVTYYFAIDTRDMNPYLYGFTLKWDPLPANDDFETAEAIGGRNGSVNGSTALATVQPGEPAEGTPPSYVPYNTVWYAFTAPVDGWIRFDAVGDRRTPALNVFTGTQLDELARIAYFSPCANLFGEPSCLAFPVTAGSTRYVRLDTLEVSDFALDWRYLERPPNDDFANALPLEGESAATNGTTTDATQEAGEPAHDGGYGTSSAWYEWTPPADGLVRIETTAKFNSVVGVYAGAALDNLSAISRPPNSHTYDLVGGRTYKIAADGSAPTESGDFTLTVNCPVTAKPRLTGPSNHSRVKWVFLFLSWDETPCASHYQVVLREGSKKGPFKVRSTEVLYPSLQTPRLTHGITYFWRVKACSAYQCTTSKWRSFKIKN